MSDPTSLDERDGDVTLLAEEVWQTAQGESRFASAARMRLVHTDLLVRDDETEESAANVREAFLNRAGMFLLVGEKTGAVLDDLDDRWTAQSQLDYWYTVLHRSGKQPQRPKLAPFDEQAVPSLEDQPCPYRGLAAFDTGDREVYFGREKLLKELIARLAEVPLVAVLGSSGSGKSSLMRAGLVPALRSGRFLPGSDQWLMLPMMLPGSNPLLNLAETLLTLHARESGSPPWFQPPSWNPNELAQILLDQPDVLARVFNHETTPPVVLLVDQFEEVFTLCDQPRRTQALLSNLDGFLAARNAGAGGHRIVLTMRSDYEAYLMKYPEFRQAFDRGRVPVTPLEKEELRAAIEEPARRVGLIFEKTLVDRLIDDTFGEPGSLPLLQFTLTRLWQTRRRNKVLMEAYTGLGGARRALATVADSVYEKLILQEREAARRIFLRIVRPGQGLEVTNQRIAEHELFTAGEDHDRISRVLEKLIQEGLIRRTVGLRPEDTQIEVAHEALVRNWPLLVVG